MQAAHPLFGANLATLLRLLARSGGVPPRHWPTVAALLGSAVGRWPFYTAERLALAGRLSAGDVKAPVFIIGHWRSGTTHLYNILSKTGFGSVSPFAAGMPWELLGLVRLIRPLLARALPKTRYIDNIPVNPDSPQEDEIPLASMGMFSFFHGIYFPRRFHADFNRGVFFDGMTDREIDQWRRLFIYFLAKLSIDQGRRRLLIKNPVYTARLGMLQTMLPDAKFIHIYRNPYNVFMSSRKLYATMLKAFALQPYDHLDIDAFVLSSYARMMSQLMADKREVDESRLVELRYEDLERDPLGEIAQVYDTLDLPGFDRAERPVADYLESVRAYRKSRHEIDEASARAVERNWGRYLDLWNYSRPGRAEGAAA